MSSDVINGMLRNIHVTDPVYPAKEGRVKILTFKKYEKIDEDIELLTKLSEAEKLDL